VNLAVAVLLLWIGSALMWVATHATGAASPWQVYTKITSTMGGDIKSA
jgi:hypothetical protein